MTSLVACGARTDPWTDEEKATPDCAVEDQRLADRCQSKCSAAASSPNGIRIRDVSSTPCIDACIADAKKECEATSSCRCSLALTKLSGG
jgi:hypothetical protein